MSTIMNFMKKSIATLGIVALVSGMSSSAFAATLPNGTANNSLATSSDLCKLNVGFVIDRSNSIRNDSEANPNHIKKAVSDVVTSLQGTDSKVAVWSFGTKATGYVGANIIPNGAAITAADYPGIGFTAVKDATGIAAINNVVSSIPFASDSLSTMAERNVGWTNWQAALGEANANGSTPNQANILFVITDGAPTLPRNFATNPATQYDDITVESVTTAVNAADTIKASAAKTRIIALAVGHATSDSAYIDNLKRITGGITGAIAGEDYYTSNFAQLGTTLKTAIKQACVPVTPTTPTTPPALPKTGTGSTLAVFTGIAGIAAGAHYIVRRRLS